MSKQPTLTLNNVSIYKQNFGSVWAIFLTSPDKEAIERRYYSFYNHEATNGELDWWSDTCALFWVHDGAITAEDKLMNALTMGALAELLNAGGTKGKNPMWQASDLACERFNAIQNVNWYQSAAKLVDVYSMGASVRAEKPVGDFSDVLEGVVTSSASHAGITQPEVETEEAVAA